MGADYRPSPEKSMLIKVLGNIAAGIGYNIPALEILTGIYSADVDFPDMRIQVQIGGAWQDVSSAEGTMWMGVAGNHVMVPVAIISDGANYRIYNSGANQIDAVSYTYEL